MGRKMKVILQKLGSLQLETSFLDSEKKLKKRTDCAIEFTVCDNR